MRAAIIAILCVGFAAGGVVRADLEKGDWAPDIEAKEWVNTDEPITLYECRGMVVVLFFWVTWERDAEDVLPLMNLVNSEFGRSQGVFMVGLTDAERSRVQEMLEEERVLFPVGTESKSYEDYDISRFPRVVVIDPRGKVGWTGWAGAGGTLISEIRAIAAETPPTKTHPEEMVKVRAYLKQARQALRGDDFKRAYKSAQNAYDRALTGDPLKTRCQDMVDLVEALGRDKLARVEQAVDDKSFDDAVTLLREIKREFKGADVARKASRRLRALQKKYSEVAEYLAQRQDEGRAENLLAQALDAIRAREFGPAYEKLEDILSEYESAEAAVKARIVKERVEKNDSVMAYVHDHLAEPECQTLLSRARSYEHSGRIDRAKELYREVIEKHRGTKWADIARRQLAEL